MALRLVPLRPGTASCCCLRFGSLTTKASCKYLVRSHVISPAWCCSFPHPVLRQCRMLAENIVCRMGANPDPKKGFVLGLSLGSVFKTSGKAICSS